MGQNYPPNCPPTSVLLVLKMKFFAKNICFVLMEIAKAASFGTRRSVVRIHSPRPFIPLGIIELRRLKASAFNRRFAFALDSVPTASILRHKTTRTPPHLPQRHDHPKEDPGALPASSRTGLRAPPEPTIELVAQIGHPAADDYFDE